VHQRFGLADPLPAARRLHHLAVRLRPAHRQAERSDQPTRGWFADLSQDLAGFGGDVKYLKTETDAGWYWGFNKDFIFSATGSAGYIEGWGGDNIRINDRFYKGGDSSAASRSPVSARATPTTQSSALGAKLYAIGTFELTVPTFLPEQYGIKAAVFSDFGTAGQLGRCRSPELDGVFNPNIKDNLGLRASAGLSIDWKSPMGPIRFDFSHILAKEDYDRTETFRFSTSTRFQRT
jgi:outer membrane protein insertion porin family